MLLSDMECYHNVRMLSNTKKKNNKIIIAKTNNEIN